MRCVAVCCTVFIFHYKWFNSDWELFSSIKERGELLLNDSYINLINFPLILVGRSHVTSCFQRLKLTADAAVSACRTQCAYIVSECRRLGPPHVALHHITSVFVLSQYVCSVHGVFSSAARLWGAHMPQRHSVGCCELFVCLFVCHVRALLAK
jgi:hypothetical protein